MPKEEKPKVEIVMENSSITDTATGAVLGGGGGGAVNAAAATRRHTDSESSENGGAGGDIPSKKPKLDTGVGGTFYLKHLFYSFQSYEYFLYRKSLLLHSYSGH